MIYTRDRQPVDFKGFLQGKTAHIICGGPSALDLDLGQLARRGCWTMAVNNAAGLPQLRPNSFVCCDPPSKFHEGIWLDPAVMKFLPKPKLSNNRGTVRRKLKDGEFERSTFTNQCPNTWGFDRRNWLVPDDSFFAGDGIPWGNLDAGVKRTGQEKTVCTMITAIGLLQYFGIERIFLVGVDFNMTLGYSFPQNRDQDAIDSNNRQFRIVNEWMCEMAKNGVFARHDLEIFNCNEFSGLRAFPYVSFDESIELTLEDFTDEPFDLEGWYEKKKRGQ